MRKVIYERWHADLIYPTGGVEVEYRDPCGCWLQHGVERMGLGLSLAWAQEGAGQEGKGKTRVKIVIPDKDNLDRWEEFTESVLAYMKDGGQDMSGRTTLRKGRKVIDCLEIVVANDRSVMV